MAWRSFRWPGAERSGPRDVVGAVARVAVEGAGVGDGLVVDAGADREAGRAGGNRAADLDRVGAGHGGGEVERVDVGQAGAPAAQPAADRCGVDRAAGELDGEAGAGRVAGGDQVGALAGGCGVADLVHAHVGVSAGKVAGRLRGGAAAEQGDGGCQRSQPCGREGAHWKHGFRFPGGHPTARVRTGVKRFGPRRCRRGHRAGPATRPASSACAHRWGCRRPPACPAGDPATGR